MIDIILVGTIDNAKKKCLVEIRGYQVGLADDKGR